MKIDRRIGDSKKGNTEAPRAQRGLDAFSKLKAKRSVLFVSLCFKKGFFK